MGYVVINRKQDGKGAIITTVPNPYIIIFDPSSCSFSSGELVWDLG